MQTAPSSVDNAMGGLCASGALRHWFVSDPSCEEVRAVDKSSVIGSLIVAISMLIVCIKASHGDFSMFWSEKGMYMIFGGTIGVIFMGMPMEKLKQVPGYCRKFFFYKGMNPLKTAELITTLSEKARREGILALESDVNELTDTFLASGLKMAIDGGDPEVIEAKMRLEIMAMQERHKAGKKFFDLIKVYAPGLGLVATLIGQIGMFGHLGGEIAILGHMLAVAVVATMYGTVLANAIAGPMGDKLAMRSSEEILSKEMMLQGIISIQSGDNPRVTQDKMLAFIPQSARDKMKLAA